MMQKVMQRTCAVGSVYVRRDDFKRRDGETSKVAVVQLEHEAFPDIVWIARASGPALGTWEGPIDVAVCTLSIAPLRFLANRWMS
jgi:hypothetical protein